MTKKQAREKKTISKKETGDLTRKDREGLKEIIQKSLVCIERIQKKEKAIRQDIDKEQKQFFNLKDESEKLEKSFVIEGMKIDVFRKVEEDYRELAPLLNQAYAYADRLGGVIKNDFLDVCQTLSNGINLPLIEEGLKKLDADLDDAS